MTDDLDFPATDPLDDELRRRFLTGSSPDSDPDAVLDTMRPRLQRARTRRRVSVVSAVGTMAALVIVLLFVFGSGGGGSSSVRTPPGSRSPMKTVPSTPTTAPSGESATPETAPNGGKASSPEPPTSIPEATVPGAAGNDSTATTSPTAPVPTEQSYTSDGGSIVVQLVDGQVLLVSSSPAAGFAAAVHDNGPTRVEVRFNNGQTEWRIRVDVVNGQLVPEITQH
jgi:hypothetical protein